MSRSWILRLMLGSCLAWLAGCGTPYVTNMFLKPPGWRAAEGYGQPALGYPP